LGSLRAFKAARHREAEHNSDDGDRKTHRDSSSFARWQTQQRLSTGSCTWRKGELSPAAINRGWPYQLALPANGGYKAIRDFCKDHAQKSPPEN
jgi:hypothetical protein